jgi:SNF2 family DNA or RNA helicase
MTGLLVLRNPEALPALVVCPTHLPRQWEEEIAKTLPCCARTSSGR